MFGLENKIVVITGGSRGIGLATAKEFMSCGARVMILHIDDSKKIDTATKDIICDVSDEAQVKIAIDSIIAEFGHIDILVNDAGIAIDKDFDSRSVADWQETLNTNLIGTFLVSKYTTPHIPAGGAIVNLSSTNGNTIFNPLSIDYDSSKAGIVALTKNLAIQFAPNIRVNAVMPGMINTDLNKDAGPEIINAELDGCLLKRMGEPDEVAQAVVFLCSDHASYINGTTLIIDGGRL